MTESTRQYGWWASAIFIFIVMAGAAHLQRPARQHDYRQSYPPSLSVASAAEALQGADTAGKRDGGGAAITPLQPTTRPAASAVSQPATRYGVCSDDRLDNAHLIKLYEALREQESRSWDYAIGDRGKSRGAYQIQKAYWQDACEFGHIDLDYLKYSTNRKACELIMYLYWCRYCPEILADYMATGNIESAVKLGRVHNGGPAGHLEPCTEKYGQKIRRRLCGS